MNRLKPIAIISTLFLSTVSVQSFAIANNQLNNQKDKSTCEIIIDAGSSGSRLHLFKITPSQDSSFNVPDEITDLTATKDTSINVNPGISSYADNPEQAGASIADLLNRLEEKSITKENCKQQKLRKIPIYLNATAGMRLVPKKQQKKIYNAINNAINFKIKHSKNKWKNVQAVKTIPGWQEGLFDWLSLNYENIKSKTATSGALDLGGASTQLAFDIKNSHYSNLISKTKDDKKVVKLKLNNKKYKIFSISFLGLGQDQARENILKTSPNSFYYCYPKDTIFNEPKSTSGVAPASSGLAIVSRGAFMPMVCNWAANRVLDQKDVYSKVNQYLTIELTSQYNDKKFVAFSGFYYTSDFFNKAQNLQDLSNSIKEKCKDNWSEFKANNPGTPSKYLINECINGSYTKQLLHYGYKFPINNSDKIKFTSDVDWTKGAALYYFLKK
jgi:Golgi nucleoside diphosphatase